MNSVRLFLLTFVVSFTLKAEVVVVFFEYKKSNGQIISFDPGGRFYHAALKYADGYIEAHPYYGVHYEKNVKKVGHPVAVLKSKRVINDLDQRVKNQLDKDFDLYSPWNDEKTTQCSKLVGQILGVTPVKVQGGNISLSPDTLYHQLVKMGYRPCMSCLSSL